MDEIKIGGQPVGPEHPTYIIAEAGSNHDQDVKQAGELIQAAAAAGADAVKFQLFDADVLCPGDSDAHETMSRAELPRDWLPDLREQASSLDIDLFASPFDPEAVSLLVENDVPAIKIASSELVNHELLQLVADTGLPVVASTAMSDLADVHEAVELIHTNGGRELALLQCTALYPCEPSHVHLRAMDTLRQAFNTVIGFSDHTLGTWAPVAAVARGASIIEKHFTLDRSLDGPDHHYALEPSELEEMVDAIRNTETALGSPEKRMLPEEAGHARREGLHASRPLEPGQILRREDFKAQRPAAGAIPARFAGAIEGRTLQVGVDHDGPIRWEDLKKMRFDGPFENRQH